MITDVLRGWPVAEIPLHHQLEFLLADWPFGVPFSCGFLNVPFIGLLLCNLSLSFDCKSKNST